MALRTTNDLTLSTRSTTEGRPVTATVKVENTNAEAAQVALEVEGLAEGALAVEPASQAVPARGRKVLSFTLTPRLPGEKPAHTFRGKLVLRRVGDGQEVGRATLDLYVAR